MALQQFFLVFDRVLSGRDIDRVFELADVGVGISPRCQTSRISVDRHAPTLLDAILGAVRDLEGRRLVPTGVKPDDLVTPDHLAARVARSMDAVQRWCDQMTGVPGFPTPVIRDSAATYYQWSLLAPWLGRSLHVDLADDETTMAAADLALRLRALAPWVERMAAIRSLIVV
jgi:hypothetical protein